MTADEPDKKATQSEQEAQAGQDTEPATSTQSGEDVERDSEAASDPETEAAIQAAVEAALAEQQDSVMRAKAEVQNMRRRCEQDVEKAHKFALEKFSGALLSVADNLERALQAVPDREDERVSALVEGVELTLKDLKETFSRFNIEQVDPEGEPFDPQLHEAMSMQPSTEVEPNTVLTVVQKGYTLNGRVLRPAMVIVSKKAEN